MTRGRLFTLFLIVGVFFVAAAVGARFLWPEPQTDKPTTTDGGVPIGGPFALTDHTGKPRTEKDFRGRLMLVFFGFTRCPDVCPTTLQTVTEALKQVIDRVADTITTWGTEGGYFVDDREANCAAAAAIGMRTHRFSGAAGLRAALVEAGVLA